MPGRIARAQLSERPAQIDLQRPPPVVGIGSRKRAHRAELTRIVDQEIYRPDRRLDRGAHALHLLAVGDIAPYGERVPPAACYLTSDTGDIVLGTRADGYGGTCVTQGQGNGPADTPARPSDQRDLSLKTNRRQVLPQGHGTLPFPGLTSHTKTSATRRRSRRSGRGNPLLAQTAP
jgi:hypothetical protein